MQTVCFARHPVLRRARFVFPFLTVRLDQPVALASLQHCIILTQSTHRGSGGDEVPVAHHRHCLQQKATRLQ
jgi:hypothetical protein